MIKLKLGFGLMVDKVKDKNSEHIDKFYEDLTRYNKEASFVKNITQQ
jgi:hypothetical protein